LATSSQASTVPSSAAACPFIAGPMIENPALFIGRKDLLDRMTTLMTGLQPTSINVVGERRIGKSSLLYHFYQTWEQRVAQRERYVVVYLSLQEAKCHTQQSFYLAVAKRLLQHPQVQADTQLRKGLKTPKPNAMTFEDLCERWKKEQVLPVLCLDEFEVWLRDKKEFDDAFFDHLRSLMNNSTLMLIIASQRPLDEYSRQHQLTSPFFNLGRQLRLEGFSDDEVTDLLLLPASTTAGAQEALSADEQQIARRWGGDHPYLLQLAASLLWQAQQRRKDQGWARAQFESEKVRFRRAAKGQHSWTKPLPWLAWKFPQLLGDMIQRVGKLADNLIKWALGITLLLLLCVGFILVLLRVITLDQIWATTWAWVKNVVGGTG
jgi:uncharacterized protein